MKNQTWLVVDKDGTEFICADIPTRGDDIWIMGNMVFTMFWLPNGSIKKLIGKDLAWDDEPVLYE